MCTFKVVIIGNSGVGKTSLRGQYVSGHVSIGLRSTIGTDFITKTLPHHSKPDESVSLQIWVRPPPPLYQLSFLLYPPPLTRPLGYCGKECFSTLSSAFFCGADAVILIFDVDHPETLRALDHWWSEFCACAPLGDNETEDYCLVVVGNKTDLVSRSEGRTVSEEAALDFIDELALPSGSPSSSLATPEDGGNLTPRIRHVPDLVPSGPDVEVLVHDDDTPDSDASDPMDIIPVDETLCWCSPHHPRRGQRLLAWTGEDSTPAFTITPRTPSIDLLALHHKRASKRRSHASQFSLAPHGTVSSTHTDFTSFHAHASSFSDGHEPYHSALSSPFSHSCSPLSSSSPPFHNHTPYRLLSASAMSTSTSTAPTITPERCANDLHTLAQANAARPAHGPRLFSRLRKRVYVCRRYSPTSLAASSCAGNGRKKRFT